MIYLGENDIIKEFKVENGILTLLYGKIGYSKIGKVEREVIAFEVGDKEPFVVSLTLDGMVVNIYYKTLRGKFDSLEDLIIYLDENVKATLGSSTVAKEIIIGSDTEVTDSDLQDMFALLKKSSGQDIKF